MNGSVFPYPGGKTYLASWIIDHFPSHNCYVEMFGGSGSVLFQKEPSYSEVYNDKDGDIVQFFRVLRDQHEELVEWLNRTPYAREQHLDWAEQFYNEGVRPDDPVERAGRFFFLRYTQYAAKYDGVSGFAGGQQRNRATQFRNATEELPEFVDRLQTVQIENRDYSELIDFYDREDTFFYADPPYLDEGDDLYLHGEFDHERFIDTLESIDGKWMVSYQRVPERLEDYTIVEKGRQQFMNKGHNEGDRSTDSVERLIMNYDAEDAGTFTTTSQTTLDEI